MDDDEFYTRQGEALDKLLNAMIAATPEWWNEATLDLKITDEGCEHSIKSFLHPRDPVTPTMDIFEATGELEQLFQERGEPWEAARFKMWREDGVWKYSMDYMY